MKVNTKLFVFLCGFLTIITIYFCHGIPDNTQRSHYKRNNHVTLNGAKETHTNSGDRPLFLYPGYNRGQRDTNIPRFISARDDDTEAKTHQSDKQNGETVSKFNILQYVHPPENAHTASNHRETGATIYPTVDIQTPQVRERFDGSRSSRMSTPVHQNLTATTTRSVSDTVTAIIENERRERFNNKEDALNENSDKFEALPAIFKLAQIVDDYSNWTIPPTDYYKCGRCICSASENGLIEQANCEQLKLQVVPQDLPIITSYLSLHDNNLPLVFNQLSYYTSLVSLDISFNHIKAIHNTTCNKSLFLHTLDLSDNQIATIDDYSFRCLPHLKHLILRRNLIKIWKKSLLDGIRSLYHLDISQNNLTAIEPSSFISASSLRVLKLNTNKRLTYSTKVLNSKLFGPLKELEVLHIQGVQNSNTKYPTAALLELTHLQELIIDGVQTGKFESNLTALKSLSVLKIGVDGHCSIHNIYSDYFLGLPYLKSVHVSGCKPKSISPLAFKSNNLLEDLTYSNMAVDFNSLFESLSGLANTPIKSLTISNVRNFSKNTACRFLGAQHVKSIKNMDNLKELNLENNMISLVQYGFLANLPPTLEKLSVRGNTLQYFRTVIANKTLLLLKHLVEVSEDRQNSAESHDDILERDACPETEGIICGEPAERTAPSQLGSASQYLTRPISVPARKNSSTSLGYILPPNLEIYSAAQSFHFGENLLSRRMEKNRVRYYNISNTYITDWGSKLLPQNVRVADFSNNFCYNLKPGFFGKNNSLKEFYAAGNYLGDVFSRDEKGDILSRLDRVMFVDLSRNHIQLLPSQIFKGLARVKVINLSINNIQIFNVSMSHMKSLQFINLNRNSISWISRKSRDDLDSVNIHHHVSLDLTSNRLPCTCAGIELLQWLATTNVRILKKEFLNCENDDNEMTLIGDLHERLTSLKQNCASKTSTILVVSFSIILFLVISLSALVFRNRWRLHYLRNIAIVKWFGHKPHIEGQDNQYKFDAYILNSGEETSFVMGECLNELEHKRGHKLCVENRDLLFGSFIPCTITSAITCSRVTVPLLSPDFYDNDWCEYGVQMAVVESIQTKRKVLHLLVYKPVPADEMPEDFIKILRDSSSCEYPPEGCDEDVRAAFWDALSQTIGHITPQDGAPDNE